MYARRLVVACYADTTSRITTLAERTLLVCRFQARSSFGPAWEEPTHALCSLHSGAEWLV